MQFTSHFSCLPFYQQLVLIDVIVKNGSAAAPETERTYTPPPGWRNTDEDVPDQRPHQRYSTGEADEAPRDDKKSYTDEQRRGVLRFIFWHRTLRYHRTLFLSISVFSLVTQTLSL